MKPKRTSERSAATVSIVVEPMADVGDAADILRFLAGVEPMRGCEYSGDERFSHGDRLIREYVARLLIKKEEPRDKSLNQDLYECAQVLYLISNVEPIDDAETHCSGGRVHVGFNRVIEWIEARLLRAAGFDSLRPHKTYGEKFSAARKENPGMPLEKLHEFAAGEPVSAEIAALLREQRGEGA